MAAAYSIKFDEAYAGLGSRNGIKGAVVYANDATDAKALLEALYSDDVDGNWANATATAIAAAANMVGWTLRVQVLTPEGVSLYDVEVIGAGADDTIDEIAALMVIALNATAIDGAAYNSGTQVLTIAETTDNLGDHHTLVEWYAPSPATRKAIPGFVVDKSVIGAANTAVTATFAADSYSVPKVIDKFAE
jgi:hypothetical protein